MNGVVGFRYNNTDYYYVKNVQGDVLAIYNASGTKVASYIYDAWGRNYSILNYTPAKIGDINPFRYRSYYYDVETGLYYLQTRYYDPEVGRFINSDALEYLGDGAELSNYNLFAYCGNNSVMGCDPSGNFPILLTFIAVALFTPIGGIAAQVATSTVCYAGMAITSIWDEDVRADLNAIGWNPFNSDENTVKNSNSVSFYKGMPVFLKDNGRSWSVYAISYNKNRSIDELRHERGHGWQAIMMGPGTYGITVGIPSPFKLGSWAKSGYYYNAPWETLPDILGGVQSRSHTQEEKVCAWLYYATSIVCPPAVFLFLLWD